MHGWTDRILGDVLTLQRGFDLAERLRVPGHVPIVSSSGVSGYHSVAKVKAPGVVTGRYGTLGEVFYVDEDFWPLNTTLWVKDFKGNHPRFVSFLLQTLNLAHQNAAGAVPGVNRNALHLLPVRVPPRAIQDRIADILSAYDDLIENNIRRIKILEQMAEMIYREWFVNFRFPGYEKVRIVESESGPIPQGWKAGPLESVCDRVTDGSHWSPTTVESGRPMASSKDMHRWGLNLATCRMISDDDYDELVRNDCRPLAGDVLITKDGANYLKYCFAVEKDMDVVLLSSVAMIRPNPAEATSRYIEFHLSDSSVKTRLAGRVSGAAIPRIVLKDFRQFTILAPPIAVQRRFEQFVQPFVALCWRLIDKNENLRTTRDFLLPKLISGETSVKAAHDAAAELMEEIAQPA